MTGVGYVVQVASADVWVSGFGGRKNPELSCLTEGEEFWRIDLGSHRVHGQNGALRDLELTITGSQSPGLIQSCREPSAINLHN